MTSNLTPLNKIRIYFDSDASPVLCLIAALGEHDRSGPRERIAKAFDCAMNAAINGLVWHREDFTAIMRRYGGHCRTLFGDYNPLGQTAAVHWYATMIKADNASACVSYEKWANHGPFKHPQTDERMHVGSRFDWDGMEVQITSIHPRTDGRPHGYLVAMPTDKTRRRFTITVKDTELVKADK